MRRKRGITRGILASLVFFTLSTTVATIGITADGISGSGSVFGRISQFRSLVINGIHYDTTNAVTYINGVLGHLTDVRLGQQIIAQVDHDRKTVQEVEQFDAVTGPVTAITIIDEGLKRIRITVNQQIVETGLETVFHLDSPADIKTGEWVTVGGLRRADNTIIATALEYAHKHSQHLVSGPIDSLSGNQFAIGGLIIESPYLMELAQEDWFGVNKTVLVEGHLDQGVLQAERVIPVPEVITILSDAFDFGDIRVDGKIEEYDPNSGLMRVNGVSLQLTQRTTMHDARDNQRPFGLQDVYPGEYVTLSLTKQDTQWIARKLVRMKKVKDLMRAPIQALDAHNDVLTVLDKRLHGYAKIKDGYFSSKKLKGKDLAKILQVTDNVEIEMHKHDELKKIRVHADCSKILAPHLGDTARHVDVTDKKGKKKSKAEKLDKKLKDKIKKSSKRAYSCL